MPRKSAVQRSHRLRRENPLVPIRGDRVKAALHWKGLTNRAAARALSKAGVRISAQALDDITGEKRKRCRRSVRATLASICGRPITAAYLGGERNLVLPTLPSTPTGKGEPSVPVLGLTDEPTDMLGTIHPALGGTAPIANVEADPPLPPEYELEAYQLSADIEGALRRDGVPSEDMFDVLTATRYLLSLAFWRRWANEMGELESTRQEGHLDPERVKVVVADAASFARTLAQAVRLVLRPWLEGRVGIRSLLLASLPLGLAAAQRSQRLFYYAELGDRLDDGRMKMVPTDGGSWIKRMPAARGPERGSDPGAQTRTADAPLSGAPSASRFTSPPPNRLCQR